MENCYSLVEGDCYKLIPSLEDKSIDLVVTDPPYEIDNLGKGIYARNVNCIKELDKLNSLKFSPRDFLDLLIPKMKQFYGYFFCNRPLLYEYIGYAREHKWNFDVFILIKQNPIPAWNNHHLNDTEYCVMIREPASYFNKSWDIDVYKKTFETVCKTRIHPAEKPVDFLEKFIKVSCPQGGTVLDPFMGSGSTGVAAIKNGMRFIGFEQSRKYVDIARERMEDFTGENGLFKDGYLDEIGA